MILIFKYYICLIFSHYKVLEDALIGFGSMGKRGVGRSKKLAETRRKGVERTIITQANVELEESVSEIEGVTVEFEESVSEIGGASILSEEKCNSEVLEALVMKIVEELKSTVREGESQPKPWVEVIQGNRSLNRGMAVDFVAPTFVNGKAKITIDESDVSGELEFWENSIILFALGESLSMNAVKKFMEKT